MSWTVTVCWNLERMPEKSLLKDKRVLMASLATTRLLKVDCWWKIFYIWSPLFLKPCLLKHQLHWSAAVKVSANAVIWMDAIILSHSNLTWKRGFQTRVVLQKLQSKLSIQFHFKMLWERKIWKKISWYRYTLSLETRYTFWNF